MGRHRRDAAGHARGQRGDLDDHAQRDRGLAGRLLPAARSACGSGNSTDTKAIPRAWVGGDHDLRRRTRSSTGWSLLAVVVGVAFWVVLSRTRFGFDLRATGSSESAAVASGVNVKRMVVVSMLLSGAVAGLIGMPSCSATPTTTARPSSRHRLHRHRGGPAGPQQPGGHRVRRADLRLPDRAGQPVQHPGRHLAGDRLVTQGVIVLAVVIAYAVVRRYRVRLEQAEAPRLASGRDCRAGGAGMSDVATRTAVAPPGRHATARRHRRLASYGCCRPRRFRAAVH